MQVALKAGLAELSVAHDVDAGLRLLTDDLRDRRAQGGGCGLGVECAGGPCSQQLQDRLRPNEAADMGRQD
jgi:hypothetical protein